MYNDKQFTKKFCIVFRMNPAKAHYATSNNTLRRNYFFYILRQEMSTVRIVQVHLTAADVGVNYIAHVAVKDVYMASKYVYCFEVTSQSRFHFQWADY